MYTASLLFLTPTAAFLLKQPGTEITTTQKKPLDIVLKQGKTKLVLTTPGPVSERSNACPHQKKRR
jgi:hypothetical protein